MLNRKNSVECYSNYLLDNLNGNNIIDMPLGNVIPKEYAIKNNIKCAISLGIIIKMIIQIDMK